jgi:Zn-finger nucleic acid-binding protein
MKTVDRAGVQFDMCPTCRGVWLDRGELEKLMASGTGNASPPTQPDPYRAPPQQQPWSSGYGERGEQGEYGERGNYRRKRSSIFDIFD